MAPVSENITWHHGITPEERVKFTAQVGSTVWFTGLSASGKSTVACALEEKLLQMGKRSFRLDGDNIRMGLNKDLGFSASDRTENIRRIGEVAKLFASSCTTCLTAFISPYEADRALARKVHEESGYHFVEVFVDVPLEVAEARDPKGLYKKARAGTIPEFTGISAPYEAPKNPEVHIKINDVTVEQAVDQVIDYLKANSLL